MDEHGDCGNIVNPPMEPQPLPPQNTRWYFDKEQLMNTPTRRAGIDPDKELTYRQQSANFIQDMGQRLQVNQLCINTAIVYMHRFYMYHSFLQFQKNAISTASIFLAAKVEEQPRKLEYVIKIAHYCLYRDTMPAIDVKSEAYTAQSTELVSNENILLQTLGFDVSVDHPHAHVVKCCQLVRASKDLAQTSYFMATNSLHLTTMCLQYPPSVVACVCIHLACKWSNWEIPRSKEGREWYFYVDGSVTPQQLELLTAEFLNIFNKSPSRLKKKILSLSNATSGGSGGSGGTALTNFPTHFTVDRNSSGAQTIKSRSRSPSPTSSSTPNKNIQRPSTSKQNPQQHPGTIPMKVIPPPPPGGGGIYPTKNTPIGHLPPASSAHSHNKRLPDLTRPPYQPPPPPPSTHVSQGQVKSNRSHTHGHGIPRDSYRNPHSASVQQPHHSTSTQHTSSNGNIHSRPHQQQLQHPTGSHPHPPSNQSQRTLSAGPSPYNQSNPLLKPGLKHPQQQQQSRDNLKSHHHPTSSTHTNNNNNNNNLPQIPHSQSTTGYPKDGLNYMKNISSTSSRSSLSEYLKKRPAESSVGDSSISKIPRLETSSLIIDQLLPEDNTDKHPSIPIKIKTEIPTQSSEDKKFIQNNSNRIELKGLIPIPESKIKQEPYDQCLPIVSSLSTTFPLLSSEIGLTSSTTPSAGFIPKLSGNHHHGLSSSSSLDRQNISMISSSTNQVETEMEMVTSTESHPSKSSSPKKKKKKKEHKHKKDKEKKEYRHKDEKKHKKDKHRDKDKKDSKKKKQGSSSSVSGGGIGISSHVQDNNSLKIKIVSSKDGIGGMMNTSKSSSSSSRSGGGGSSSAKLQSNTVVDYY